MKTKNLYDLYVAELKDLYSAEKQLLEALPKVIEAAADKKLKTAVSKHLAQTTKHVERLEQVFTKLGEKPGAETCEGMKGLIKESDKAIKELKDPALCDAALIGCAQRIEHYEIAGYGTACAFAEELGYEAQVKLLEKTMDEESDADEKLTDIALATVNPAAARVGEPATAGAR